jgi:threonyl-tRNA synthetase
MFVCETVEGEELSLKPMNCPGHVQIFRFGQKSLSRSADAYGRVRRVSPLRAVRRAARPDARARVHAGRCAHLLPRGPDRRGDASFIELASSIHSDFGLERDHITLAHAPRGARGFGRVLGQGRSTMLSAARKAGVEPVIAEGDGAFYAPKLDFHQGRDRPLSGRAARSSSTMFCPSASVRNMSVRTAPSTPSDAAPRDPAARLSASSAC